MSVSSIFLAWVNAERYTNGEKMFQTNKKWQEISYEELFIRISILKVYRKKKIKRRHSSSSNRLAYYICLPSCESPLLIKGWQMDEKEVVGQLGKDRCCVSKYQMSLVFLQGQVQLKLGMVWHLWKICVTKRKILSKAVFLQGKNLESQAYGSAQEWKVIVQRKTPLLVKTQFPFSSAIIGDHVYARRKGIINKLRGMPQGTLGSFKHWY